MKIFPAIDLYGGKAVRLYKGNYNEMTVYSDNPVEIALDFKEAGAEYMHVVDLEGAKTGDTPNIETIKKLVNESGLFVEVGGGIRSIEVIKKYLDNGVQRVILGTAAVTDREFLKTAIAEFGDHVAVGVDIKDGFVAIKGWTEKSTYEAFGFLKELEELGVKTVICTDISKDGAMQGTNHELYNKINNELSLNVIASGGVSSMDDVIKLARQNVYGAIIGKAYYVKAISLKEAIEVAK
ncbi:MAG: 1-(5-phosphoribosyl)-5-[(5-phosphoribosylamino)methylideneamino]imidazole-4-carboxamide isomerase [Clostridia bacterium]|nr:1-(5-phosphoribosyl)-5-[(5-phosphoribosylamino)methylideneamino]imidazole-4-carboxamide isomerase [Clostridia bacterium]